jgi:hypothetical protein
MRVGDLRLGTVHPGLGSPVRILRISAALLAVIAGTAHADAFEPTQLDPDPPARRAPPSLPPAAAAPSSDLDGLYLWLGPSGAASHIESDWDSTIGADLTVIRVREGKWLGAIGGSFGASRWTVRDGGRIWLDGLIGTRLGRMMGLSAGPILELGELAHPRLGGSVGIWAFLGVTPYVRAGTVSEMGGFVEIGVHIALPVLRFRR